MYWSAPQSNSTALASLSTNSLDDMLDRLPVAKGPTAEQLDDLLMSQDVLVRLRRGHDRRLATLLGHPDSLHRLLRHALRAEGEEENKPSEQRNLFLSLTAIPDRATT